MQGAVGNWLRCSWPVQYSLAAWPRRVRPPPHNKCLLVFFGQLPALRCSRAQEQLCTSPDNFTVCVSPLLATLPLPHRSNTSLVCLVGCVQFSHLTRYLARMSSMRSFTSARSWLVPRRRHRCLFGYSQFPALTHTSLLPRPYLTPDGPPYTSTPSALPGCASQHGAHHPGGCQGMGEAWPG